MGGGLATLYFSVFAARNFYGLIEIAPAFALMGLVTVLAGGIAVRFNSMLVAVLGVLGGYGTPLMLPMPPPVDFFGLYGYLVVLGVGVLGVCYWKNWPLVNLLSFLCTYGLYFTAMQGYRVEDFGTVMPFLTAFFVLFSTMTFLYKLVNRASSNLLDLAALLVNAFLFFGESYRLVTPIYGKEWAAVVTLGLAAFYTLHVYYFLARKLVDRELLVSFLGLASFFVIVTVPLLLSRQWITLSWAIQALVLLWIARQLGSHTLKYISFVLYGIVLFRFALSDLPGQFALPLAAGTTWAEYWPHLVERLVMFGVPVLSLAGAAPAAGMGARRGAHRAAGQRSSRRDLRQLGRPGAAGTRRRGDVLLPAPRTEPFCGIRLCAAETAGAHAAVAGILRDAAVGGGRATKPAAVDGGRAGAVRRADQAVRRRSAGVVAFGTVVVRRRLFLPRRRIAAVGLRRRDRVFRRGLLGRRRTAPRRGTCGGLRRLRHGRAVRVFDAGSQHVPGCVRPRHATGGVSILWSIFAFTWLLRGIWRNNKPLRYAGLTLFTIVVIKVFFRDLAELDQFYRIIAFIVLGIVVLAGSFVYLKYRETFTLKTADSPREPA